jgi:hypothetical protein
MYNTGTMTKYIYYLFKWDRRYISHSQMEHYFFSYLLTWEVDIIEILEILAQMWHYVIFLSLKPTRLYFV